jgi:valyl-tRNA synthetase
MQRPFPHPDAYPRDAEAEAAVDWLKGVVGAIRNIRGEMRLSPATEVQVLLQGGGAAPRARLADTEPLLRRLAKVSAIRFLGPGEAPPPVATQVAGDLKVMVPLAGLIDAAAERARLKREIGKLAKDLARVDGKLGNPGFLANAPAPVVAKQRERGAALRQQIDALAQQRQSLAGLDP